MQTFWKNVEDMSLSFLLKYFENDVDDTVIPPENPHDLQGWLNEMRKVMILLTWLCVM